MNEQTDTRLKQSHLRSGICVVSFRRPTP